MAEHENGRAYPHVSEFMKSGRDHVMQDIKSCLTRLEDKQDQYGNRLTAVENRINAHLELVASNTTSMSRSLEAIQFTNSKLVDAISGRNVVPTVVMVIVLVLMAGIFLTRELAMTGGHAKLSLDGLDISSGHHAVLDLKETPGASK